MSSMTSSARFWYGCCAAGGATFAYWRFGPGVAKTNFDNYPRLDRHHNLMSLILTRRMYWRMLGKHTPSGFTIDQIIQPGVDAPGDAVTVAQCGAIAGDAECYVVFSELFDGIIEQRHQIKLKRHTVRRDFGANSADGITEYDINYVRGCCIRIGRNVEDVPFQPAITRGQRRLVAKKIAMVCKELELDCRPLSYWDKSVVDPNNPNSWISGLVGDGNPWMPPAGQASVSSGYLKDWPDGRMLFRSANGKIYGQVNHRQHLSITSKDKAGDLSACFRELASFADAFEDVLERQGESYQFDQRLGFLGPEPGELGSALSIEIRLALPLLSEQGQVHRFLADNNLRSYHHAFDKETGEWTITTPVRMGRTERDCVESMAKGTSLLIAAEKQLEQAVEDGVYNTEQEPYQSKYLTNNPAYCP